MEIFVRDAESETGKWRSILVNVSFCLLTSRPIPERHFHFHTFGHFWEYEDTKWLDVTSKVKQILG